MKVIWYFFLRDINNICDYIYIEILYFSKMVDFWYDVLLLIKYSLYVKIIGNWCWFEICIFLFYIY